MTPLPTSRFADLQKGLLSTLLQVAGSKTPAPRQHRELRRTNTGSVQLAVKEKHGPDRPHGERSTIYEAVHHDFPDAPVRLSVMEGGPHEQGTVIVHPGAHSSWPMAGHRDLVQQLLANHPKIGTIQVFRPGTTTSPKYDLPTLVTHMTRRSVWDAHLQG